MGDKAQWRTNVFQSEADWMINWGMEFLHFLIISFLPSFAWLYPALLKIRLLGFSGDIKMQNATVLKGFNFFLTSEQ